MDAVGKGSISRGPPKRQLGDAAYDSRRQRLMVSGGRVGREGFTRGDTWTWDGTVWRESRDSSVGIRNHHSRPAFGERAVAGRAVVVEKRLAADYVRGPQTTACALSSKP